MSAWFWEVFFNFSDPTSLCSAGLMNTASALGEYYRKQDVFCCCIVNEKVKWLAWYGWLMETSCHREKLSNLMWVASSQQSHFSPSILIHSTGNSKAQRYLLAPGVTTSRLMVGLVKKPTVGLQTTKPSNLVKLTQNRLNRKSNQEDIKPWNVTAVSQLPFKGEVMSAECVSSGVLA